MSSHRKLLILSVLALVNCPAFAGEPDVKPANLIERAVQASDIWSTGPVRLRLAVTFFNVKAGKIEGEYKKIWISPQRWRVEFRSAEFNETTVGGDGRAWYAADNPEQPLRILQFERAVGALSQTFVESPSTLTFKLEDRGKGAEKVQCVQVDFSRGTGIQDCLDPATGLLRVVTEGDWTFLFSDYREFLKKMFPQTISVFDGISIVATGRVVELENYSDDKPEIFQALSGVESYNVCSQALGLPLGGKGGKLLKGPNPTWPNLPAGYDLIEKNVSVSGVVGRDGLVRYLHASGSRVREQPALNAVKQWRFEPFTVCGNPVEMPIKINFNTYYK